jgi:PTS system mannose-specific IIA component
VIGILVVTHGQLSEALLATSSMFVANTARTRAVSFMPGQGIEDLENEVISALRELEPNDGVLAMVDLPGGSPARVVGSLLARREGVELVTGVNLPMLIEVLIMRESMSLSELADHAVTCGNEAIVNVGKMLRT